MSFQKSAIDADDTNKSHRPSATVDELLEMLSGSSTHNSRRQQPPPLPPKPKTEFKMTVETAKRRLGLLSSDRQQPSMTYDEGKPLTNTGIAFDGDTHHNSKSKPTSLAFSSKQDIVQRDTKSDYADGISSAPKVAMQDQRQQVPPRAKAMIGSYVVYDSSLVNVPHINDDRHHLSASSTVTIKQDTSSVSKKLQPFVTEYHDDSYTSPNNNSNRGPAVKDTNTVEIFEVPNDTSIKVNIDRNRPTEDIHKIETNSHIAGSVDRSTGQSDQALSFQPAPYITSATDDEDYSYDVDISTKSPIVNNEPAESIFGVSTDGCGAPPRTSTPSSSTHGRQNHFGCNSTASSSGNSTGTNNNISSQNSYLSHGLKHDSNESQVIGDNLDISRETDESTNTSIHNLSGGCKLVGLNDNSDSRDQSPRVLKQQHQITSEDSATNNLCTDEFFNRNLMSSATNSPPGALAQIGRDAKTRSDITDDAVQVNRLITQDQETNHLEKLVGALQNDVGYLSEKVSNLTSKVEDLEYQLDIQRKENINFSNRPAMTSNLNTHSQLARSREQLSSPSSGLMKQTFSQSTSTINRQTPIKSTRHTNSVYGQTYSRNAQSVSNPRRHHQYDYDKSSQALSAPRPYAASNGKTSSRQSKDHYHHASTNSIYRGDSVNISSSVSPSFSQNIGQQVCNSIHSPSSLMSLSRSRQDNLNTCTSMLSLSSIGASTLKKGSIAGSVSNLSQFGGANINLSAQWPSQNSFVASKHQGKDVLYDEEERIIRMMLYNTLITMHLPSWIGEDYNFDQIVEPPAVRLKLAWVQGYRGRDCRSNLYYLPTGECVYFVASIVVLYNVEEKSQRHYLGHTDSVKCLAVHPNKLIIASGQSAVLNRRDKRPTVRVWNTVSLATLRVIGFNEDFDRSICCLAFSRHDQGATLAVVDESSEHTITLLDWQRDKNWRIAEANSGHEPVLMIDFHPMDKFGIVAVGRSTVNFWDIRGVTLAKKAGLFDKYDRPKYVLCFTFNDLGETITGDSNGNIIIWPPSSNKARQIIRNAHTGGVFSILAMKDGTFLTGGRDRKIIEWDESFVATSRQVELPEHCGGVRFISSGRGFQVLIGTLRNCILVGSLDCGFILVMQGHAEAITALAIHPSQRKYLTGGFDDQIHLINSSTHQVEWSKCLAQPITASSYSPNGNSLILGSVSGNWIVIDPSNQAVVFEACDGSGTITCVKFSPDGKQFCLGSSDCHIYAYSTNEDGSQYKRIGACVGHSAPVKEIDWSDDGLYIQTQSMNFELLFWRVSNCRPLDDEAVVSDLTWHTQNCTIGFNTIGIWSESIDSALISYCDKSRDGKLIISSTDIGDINVFKAPAYYNSCLSQKYCGNVDKFNFIKFLCDDSRVIAVGSKNCVTTEWAIEKVD